ncbi:DUF3089 domain-containing protein [Fretibacter rubidus]|uniref:DUF3089 domain-containing protein n=1 Tax=Fretibacter rubidus TaxID=570162 RepID=UPI00352BB6C6
MANFSFGEGKKIVATMAGLIVLIALGLFFYRNDIFQSLQDPGVPFQTYDKPVAPDYADPTSWLAIPDLSADVYDADAPADAFIVVPGVYRGGKHWVLPVDVDRRRERLQRIVRPNYVAPYGYAGRLFAPYYRHAAMYSYMTNREDAQRARDFAYKDIRRAFEVFLSSSPPERPIILAGHGQGADHVTRLLSDYFNGPLKDRLAVAYIIDHPVPMSLFDSSLSHLKPCGSATDYGCVVAYGAFMPGDKANAKRFATNALYHNGRNFEKTARQPLLCTNPLSWTVNGQKVDATEHKGGMAAEGIEPDRLPPPLPRQSWAECQDGLLQVGKPRSKALRRPLGLGARFWTLPSNLFFEDLRINARARVQSLIATGKLPTRVKRLDDLEVIDIIESPVTPVKE